MPVWFVVLSTSKVPTWDEENFGNNGLNDVDPVLLATVPSLKVIVPMRNAQPPVVVLAPYGMLLLVGVTPPPANTPGAEVVAKKLLFFPAFVLLLRVPISLMPSAGEFKSVPSVPFSALPLAANGATFAEAVMPTPPPVENAPFPVTADIPSR